MIELITTSLFVFSSIYGSPTTTAMDNLSTSSVPENPIVETTNATNILTGNQLETKAKAYFKNDPLLVEIARCESNFRQYDDNGVLLRGKVNKGDIGIMQINQHYHADKAAQMGLDLRTIDGNMAYAKYLYEKEGGQPWISSSNCWKQAIKTNPQNQVAMK